MIVAEGASAQTEEAAPQKILFAQVTVTNIAQVTVADIAPTRVLI